MIIQRRLELKTVLIIHKRKTTKIIISAIDKLLPNTNYYQIKIKLKKRINKILHKFNLGFCEWCTKIIPKTKDGVLYLPFRCSSCEVKKDEYMLEELQSDLQRERELDYAEDYKEDYD